MTYFRTGFDPRSIGDVTSPRTQHQNCTAPPSKSRVNHTHVRSHLHARMSRNSDITTLPFNHSSSFPPQSNPSQSTPACKLSTS